ncbi:two-component sensor histidine kinase [Enterococcus saigonensis]|uniref:histidine kinase n=1 Tax=Enterococcus saigonensis TaxID=1805431 RepID=A0A679IJ65_9ENTE|nr:ATP-binding protein [Enterococcus saigonensis]BCA86142.1 two-component sensor histidine kinase [Enterococcus saigonensis]
MKKQRALEYLLWLTTLIVIFVGAWQLIGGFFEHQVLSQQENYLEKKGNLLLRMAKETNYNEATLQQLSKHYVEHADERVTYLTANGKIVFDTFDFDLSGTRTNRPEVKTVLAGGKIGTSLRKSATLKKELLYVAIPVRQDNHLVGILRIAESTTAFMAEASNVRNSILTVYVILCLFITVFVLYFLRQKNRPLETLLPAIKKMVANPTRTETIMQTTPHWEELYQALNQLSEQMSHTYKAYSATERQLHTLLNDLMIGIFIVDSENRLIMMNSEMKRQLGLFQNLAEKVNFAEVVKDPQLIQLIYRITPDAPFLHDEITLHQNGERVLDVDLRLFNEERQVLVMSYDMTQVRQLEKMQQDFVSNVSHELKTPVTSLIGFTETLLDGAKDDPETTTEFLRIMEKDAKRLQALIQDIIQLSKGQQDLDYPIQDVTIAELLKQILESYEAQIHSKNLNITLTGDSALTWSTKVELFYPIVKNLIENAIKYSPEKKKITITYHAADTLTLCVTDQGVGIDLDDQQRIFERFYRVDKARARQSGGTGLGLAIVKESVEKLNGKVQLESHPGVGSTFTVILPKL